MPGPVPTSAAEQALASWRRQVSAQLGVPAYVVCTNAALKSLAGLEAVPPSKEALRGLAGVGPAFVQKHGEDVLRILGALSEKRRKREAGAAGAEGEAPASRMRRAEQQTTLAPIFNRAVAKNAVKPPSEEYKARMAAAEAEAKERKARTRPGVTMTADEARAVVSETFNDAQRRVVELALDRGKNVFFSGSAGTGKSYVLRALIALLREKHGNDGVAVVAPTGIAAVALGGDTVHKFLGAGLAGGPPERVVGMVKKSTTASKRWADTHTLIIDEVSMLDADLLGKLDAVGRAVRNTQEGTWEREGALPFGGMQVITSGDFFQLPPVAKGGGAPYCFVSEAWRMAQFEFVELTDVKRQSDTGLVHALNQIRIGTVDDATRALVARCSRPLPPREGILPTRLYAVNREVDAENARELEKLPGERVVINAVDTGDAAARELLNSKGGAAPSSLQLKVGAQVVLLRGLEDHMLANGSRGVVVGFTRDHAKAVTFKLGFSSKNLGAVETHFAVFPVVRFTSGAELALGPANWSAGADGKYADRYQIPLKLAWALTIHKSQGMTLNYVEAIVSGAFAPGQVYTALSRCTSEEGLCIRGFCERDVNAHPLVKDFYASIGARFMTQQGGGGGGTAPRGSPIAMHDGMPPSACMRAPPSTSRVLSPANARLPTGSSPPFRTRPSYSASAAPSHVFSPPAGAWPPSHASGFDGSRMPSGVSPPAGASAVGGARMPLSSSPLLGSRPPSSGSAHPGIRPPSLASATACAPPSAAASPPAVARGIPPPANTSWWP